MEIGLSDLYLDRARQMAGDASDPYAQMLLLKGSLEAGDREFANLTVNTTLDNLFSRFQTDRPSHVNTGYNRILDTTKELTRAGYAEHAHIISERVSAMAPEKGIEIQTAILGLGYLGVGTRLAKHFAKSPLHRRIRVADATGTQFQLAASYLEAAALSGTDITRDWRYGSLWAGLSADPIAKEYANRELAIAYNKTGRRDLGDFFASHLASPYHRAAVLLAAGEQAKGKGKFRHLAHRAERLGRHSSYYGRIKGSTSEAEATSIYLTASYFHAKAGNHQRAEQVLATFEPRKYQAAQRLNTYLEMYTASGKSRYLIQLMNVLSTGDLSDEEVYRALYRTLQADISRKNTNPSDAAKVLENTGRHFTSMASNPANFMLARRGVETTISEHGAKYSKQSAKLAGGFGALAVKAAETGNLELADNFLASVTTPYVRVKTLIRVANALGSPRVI